MKVEGSCHCGAIAYEATVDPQRALIPPLRQKWCASALPWSSNIESLPKSERG